MTEFYTDPLVTLLHGDCIEVMATLPADSVDAVVTDPPYGIGFMGKAWDVYDRDPVEASWSAKGRNQESKRNPDAATPGGRSTERTGFRDTNPRCGLCGRAINGRDTEKGFKVCHCPEPVIVGTPNRDAQRFQQWCTAWGAQVFRVTKPGGYLLAFGGTRTHHRLVCALEDAGWIIRDELDWIYASGFPKGKANLKPAHEPIVLARKPGPLRPLAIDESRIAANDKARFPVGYERSQQVAYGKHPTITDDPDPSGRWPSNVLLSDPELFDEPNPYVVGSGATSESAAGLQTYRREPTHNTSSYQPGAVGHEWQAEGYGDSGGYSRFFIVPKADRAERERGLADRPTKRMGIGATADEQEGEYEDFVYPAPDGIGGWLKGQRERAGLSRADVSVHIEGYKNRETVLARLSCWEREEERPSPNNWLSLKARIGFDDRYDEVMTATHAVTHYVREGSIPARANVHPTVKPIDLMRHLVKLVTPTNGVVLDPFLGSGTTALAASELGMKCIGIEREAEYLDIAKGRLIATPMGLGLDDPLVGPPQATRDGIAVRHNSGGNTFGSDSPKPPLPDMGYGVKRVKPDPEPPPPGFFEEPA